MEKKEIPVSDFLISMEEVHAFIGYSEGDTVFVIQEVVHRLNHQNHDKLYPQLRFLVICCGLLYRYKNKDITYLIMKLNSMLLNLIYSNKKNPDFKMFSFFLSVIFHFRNCRSIHDFKIAGKDESFIKKVRAEIPYTEMGFQTVLPLSF